MKPLAIVTGASSGLGEEIAMAISHDYRVIDWSLETGVDVSDVKSVIDAVNVLFDIHGECKKIDLLVNCAGTNLIRYLGDTLTEEFDHVMGTNARSIFLTARFLLKSLRGGTVLNIISTASHAPMTASLAYNASKAAAEMMTRQMAHELIVTHDITVFGVSPNKLADTAMSAKTDRDVARVRDWSAAETEAHARAARLTHKETPPAMVAEFIAFLVSRKDRHEYLAGSILEYGV
jgi:NAD(P)-dependent dehydrogenase (short-subunit alcohol dehydrogenase family)